MEDLLLKITTCKKFYLQFTVRCTHLISDLVALAHIFLQCLQQCLGFIVCSYSQEFLKPNIITSYASTGTKQKTSEQSLRSRLTWGTWNIIRWIWSVDIFSISYEKNLCRQNWKEDKTIRLIRTFPCWRKKAPLDSSLRLYWCQSWWGRWRQP